jgi:hypothetical protein
MLFHSYGLQERNISFVKSLRFYLVDFETRDAQRTRPFPVGFPFPYMLCNSSVEFIYSLHFFIIKDIMPANNLQRKTGGANSQETQQQTKAFEVKKKKREREKSTLKFGSSFNEINRIKMK